MTFDKISHIYISNKNEYMQRLVLYHKSIRTRCIPAKRRRGDWRQRCTSLKVGIYRVHTGKKAQHEWVKLIHITYVVQWYLFHVNFCLHFYRLLLLYTVSIQWERKMSKLEKQGVPCVCACSVQYRWLPSYMLPLSQTKKKKTKNKWRQNDNISFTKDGYS